MPEIIRTLLENNERNDKTTSQIGRIGEQSTALFLKRMGFILVAANFKIPIGRNRTGVAVTGEIDLVALDGETLCFIEVKTRSSEGFASALSAVDIRKQRQITRAARIYRKTFGLTDRKFRYDVVTVVLNEQKAPAVELFKGFWNETKFKKNVWIDDLQR